MCFQACIDQIRVSAHQYAQVNEDNAAQLGNIGTLPQRADLGFTKHVRRTANMSGLQRYDHGLYG